MIKRVYGARDYEGRLASWPRVPSERRPPGPGIVDGDHVSGRGTGRCRACRHRGSLLLQHPLRQPWRQAPSVRQSRPRRGRPATRRQEQHRQTRPDQTRSERPSPPDLQRHRADHHLQACRRLAEDYSRQGRHRTRSRRRLRPGARGRPPGRSGRDGDTRREPVAWRRRGRAVPGPRTRGRMTRCLTRNPGRGHGQDGQAAPPRGVPQGSRPRRGTVADGVVRRRQRRAVLGRPGVGQAARHDRAYGPARPARQEPAIRSCGWRWTPHRIRRWTRRWARHGSGHRPAGRPGPGGRQETR